MSTCSIASRPTPTAPVKTVSTGRRSAADCWRESSTPIRARRYAGRADFLAGRELSEPTFELRHERFAALRRQIDEIINERRWPLTDRQGRGEIGIVFAALHRSRVEPFGRQQLPAMTKEAVVAAVAEECGETTDTAGHHLLDGFDDEIRTAAFDRPVCAVEHALFVAFDVNFDEAGVTDKAGIERAKGNRYVLGAVVVGGDGVRNRRTTGDGRALHQRNVELARTFGMRQRFRLHGHVMRKFSAQLRGHPRYRLIRIDVARKPPEKMNIATVVRTDVDGVLARGAQEFE